MSALVEEAVTVGDLVRLFTFRQGNANLVELTLPADSPYVGKPTGLIPFPENCALVTILRDGQVYVPDAEQPIEAGDELLFVVPGRRRGRARAAARPRQPTAAEPSTAESVGELGLDRRAVAAEQPHHRRPRAAELERPAHARSCSDAERGDRACRRRSRPDWPASQIGPCTTTRSSARQQRAARSAGVHSRTTCRSSCQAGRVAGDAADHEADQRPADQAGERRAPRRSRRCRGSRAGSRPAPGRPRSPPRAAPTMRTKTPADRRSPTSALTTNCTVERCTSRTTSSTSADARRSTTSASWQVAGGQPERP